MASILKNIISTSEYKCLEYPISLIQSFSKSISLGYSLFADEVPTIQGAVNVNMDYAVGGYNFGYVKYDVTPYYKIENNDVNVYKYSDIRNISLSESLMLKKKVTFQLSKLDDTLYYGSVNLTNLSKIIFTNNDLLVSSFLEFTLYDIYEDSNITFFPDYLNNIIHIWSKDKDFGYNTISGELTYTELNFNISESTDWFVNVVATESQYIGLNKVYDLSLYYNSIKDGINEDFILSNFNGQLNSTATLDASNRVIYNFPFHNSFIEYDYVDFITFMIYNKFEREHEICVLEFATPKYPTYIFIGNNEPRSSIAQGALFTISINELNTQNNIHLPEIMFHVDSVVMTRVSTGKKYVCQWDELTNEVIINKDAPLGMYTFNIDIVIPTGYHACPTYNGIYDFSAYQSKILDGVQLFVRYNGTYYISDVMAQNTNTSDDLTVASLYLAINRGVETYAADIRNVSPAIPSIDEVTDSIYGASPLDSIIHPVFMNEYISLMDETSDSFNSNAFDINNEIDDTLITHIYNNKKFTKNIEVVAIATLNAPCVIEVEYELLGMYVLLNFKITKDTDDATFIRLLDTNKCRSIFTSLYYGIVAYDVNNILAFPENDPIIYTKNKEFSLIYNPIFADLIEDDDYATGVINFEYGNYIERYNMFSDPHSLIIDLDIENFGGGRYSTGGYSIKDSEE